MMILLTVVLGLVFLCTLAFSAFESIILWLVLNSCCRRDRKFYHLIRRNMDGHSKRNNKTSLMFTLATSFLIFAQSGFQVTVVMV